MAINDVSLTSGMRANLLSLQNTVTLLDRTQNRLSTGKKVNTAIDNPVSFFASQSLTSRASVIDSLKDAMGQAIQTITAADKGISAITTMIEQAKGIAQSAQSATSIYDTVTLADVSGGSADTVTVTLYASMTIGVSITVGTANFTAVSFASTATTQFQVTGTAAADSEALRAKIAAVLTVYTATTSAGTVTISKVDTTYGDPLSVATSEVLTNVTTMASAVVAGAAGDTLTLNLASGTEVLHATYSRSISTTAGSSSNYWFAGNSTTTTTNTADATTLAALINANTDLTGAGYSAISKDAIVTLTRAKYDITSTMVQTSNTTTQAVALSSTETSELASLVTQYNTLRTQLDELAEDAGYKGKNLLLGNTLTVKFEGATLDVVGFNAKTAGLAITSATWTTGGDIDADITKLDSALSKLRNESSKMAGNLSIITVRNDFSTNMINTLSSGSDKLTLADSNEEGANMLMLQTRQSLSTTALSLSAQAAQSVLKLFG